MKNKNTYKLWTKQIIDEGISNWRDLLKIYIHSFILMPSAILIFGYYLEFINELNKEVIENNFFYLGILSLIINIMIKVCFPNTSKPIKDTGFLNGENNGCVDIEKHENPFGEKKENK